MKYWLPLHDLCRHAALPQQPGHPAHRCVDMVKEQLVAGAQVIYPFLLARGLDKAVARAFALAGEAHITLPAGTGQALAFLQPELALAGRTDQFAYGRLQDIPQAMRRLDEVITGVQVAVMFQHQAQAAGLLKDAHIGRQTVPAGQGGIEGLHEHPAHIPPDPLIENLHQEMPKGGGLHRARADQAARPWLLPLDDRDELDETGLQCVPEKAIYLQGLAFIGSVHGAQDVRVHLMFLQQLPGALHLVETALTAFIHPVGVVHCARPVHAQPDQEGMLFEEGAPCLVQPGAVGLQAVGNLLARPFIAVDQGHRALEEIRPHQGRFAALPGHADLGAVLGAQQLFDIGLQHLVRHAQGTAWIELFFIQVEAVGAGQVARGAAGFGQQGKGGWCGKRPG